MEHVTKSTASSPMTEGLAMLKVKSTETMPVRPQAAVPEECHDEPDDIAMEVEVEANDGSARGNDSSDGSGKDYEDSEPEERSLVDEVSFLKSMVYPINRYDQNGEQTLMQYENNGAAYSAGVLLLASCIFSHFSSIQKNRKSEV